MLQTLKDHQKERTADIFFEIPKKKKRKTELIMRVQGLKIIMLKI